jgi:methionine-S-sulfoxide reductase
MRATWGVLWVLAVAAAAFGAYRAFNGPADPAPAEDARGAQSMIDHGDRTMGGPDGPAVTADAGRSTEGRDATGGRRETATLAAGCFWGVEHLMRQLPGVISTRVGYTGGTVANPTYERVCRGDTGHAEAVEVVFDPDRVSYEEVLRYFFRLHDPTTPNRQHNDIGAQYRSAIFTHSEEQRRIAEEVKAELNASGVFERPVVTQIVPAGEFWEAEPYHQDYLVKHPNGYNCHVLRPE